MFEKRKKAPANRHKGLPLFAHHIYHPGAHEQQITRNAIKELKTTNDKILPLDKIMQPELFDVYGDRVIMKRGLPDSAQRKIKPWMEIERGLTQGLGLDAYGKALLLRQGDRGQVERQQADAYGFVLNKKLQAFSDINQQLRKTLDTSVLTPAERDRLAHQKAEIREKKIHTWAAKGSTFGPHGGGPYMSHERRKEMKKHWREFKKPSPEELAKRRKERQDARRDAGRINNVEDAEAHIHIQNANRALRNAKARKRAESKRQEKKEQAVRPFSQFGFNIPDDDPGIAVVPKVPKIPRVPKVKGPNAITKQQREELRYKNLLEKDLQYQAAAARVIPDPNEFQNWLSKDKKSISGKVKSPNSIKKKHKKTLRVVNKQAAIQPAFSDAQQQQEINDQIAEMRHLMDIANPPKKKRSRKQTGLGDIQQRVASVNTAANEKRRLARAAKRAAIKADETVSDEEDQINTSSKKKKSYKRLKKNN